MPLNLLQNLENNDETNDDDTSLVICLFPLNFLLFFREFKPFEAVIET